MDNKEKTKIDENGMPITSAWDKYERGINYLQQFNYFTEIDTFYKFYDGEQWYGIGLKDIDDRSSLVVLNVIKPSINFKIGLVAQKGFVINYSSSNYNNPDLQVLAAPICDMLNKEAKRIWEQTDMDTVIWDVITDAAIAGEKYVYFSPKIIDSEKDVTIDEETQELKQTKKLEKIEMKPIDGTNILFGDENNPDIQKQPFIILPYRDSVMNLRKEAEANGVPEEEYVNIIPDDDNNYQAGDRSQYEIENSSKEGKALCLIYFKKKKGTVWMMKATKHTVIEDWQDTKMRHYPVAGFLWSNIKGSARGLGEVKPVLNNQIEINKNFMRLIKQIKTSYNILAYVEEYLPDIKPLLDGKNIIKLQDMGADAREVSQMISYIKPPPINSEIIVTVQNLINQTRDLMGSNESNLTNVDPTKASGQAIIAARDAQAVTLNGPTARAKKFVEDIARIWIDIKQAYSPNGIEVITEQEQIIVGANEEPISSKIEIVKTIPGDVMEEIKLNIKVDVSPSDPWSKYAEDQKLENTLNMLLERGAITEKEFIESLPDDFASKQKILDIFAKKEMESKQPPPNNMTANRVDQPQIDIPQSIPPNTPANMQLPMNIPMGAPQMPAPIIPQVSQNIPPELLIGLAQ